MSTISPLKFIIPLLLIPLILTIIWFRNGLIMGGGEEGLAFFNSNKAFYLSSHVWVEYGTGASVLGWLSKSPIVYLSLLSEKIGIPPFLFQLILFYILIEVALLSVYLLTLNLLGLYKFNKIIAFVSAIFYLFNPYTISQVWGRGIYAQYFSFSLFPLALLLFSVGLKRRKYVYGILIVLSSVILAAAYGFITSVIVYWVLLLSYLIYAIFIDKKKFNIAFFGIKFFSFTFILWGLVNSWWLLPLFSSAKSVYSASISDPGENLGTLIGVSRNFTPDIIIRLLQRTFFFDPSAFSPIYSGFIFQLISFIPLFFVVVGLVNTIKNSQLENFRFFVLLFILGLIISLGANPPLGWLFVWVFKSFPILQAFRNPFEKFGLVYVLGYIPLFAIGLISPLDSKKIKKIGTLLVLVLTCGVFAWPMWTGRVIAGPDRKIGIAVPSYYKDLQEWLNTQNYDYRLFMTPLWSGDGAFYQWDNGGRYQGTDPMVFILNHPAISNSAQTPFIYDFVTSIKKYMERVDISPAFSLLRAKFLVNRKDAIFITEPEKNHYKFLTSAIYPPIGLEGDLKTICQNSRVDSNNIYGAAWLFCQIQKDYNDLSNIRYLHLKLKTSEPANIEVAIRDTNEIRIRWDGRIDPEYRTNSTDWQYLTIPLATPTEYNSNINFSKIYLVEVLGHPLDSHDKSIGEISVGEIKLDPGVEKQINEFKLTKDFGNLSVYEPLNFNPALEFGTLLSIDQVINFKELFELVNKKRDLINSNGFLLQSQNRNKDLSALVNKASLQVFDKQKISNTKYWLKVGGEGTMGLILLSNTFNPEWKILPGVSKEMLNGGLFNDLNLLKKVSLDEKNHYVVNGYSNLWKIDNENTQYGIVFMPQVIADISWKVSFLGVLFLLGVTLIWMIKKYTSSH